MKNNHITYCPVCGYDLGFPAWNDQGPSNEICPSCGIQFGYDDALGGRVSDRAIFYQGWRRKWAVDGKLWFSKTTPPKNWSAETQIKSILADE